MVQKSSVELSAQRRITRALLRANHEVITLVPHRNTKTPNGGRDTSALTPREPQKFHLIELGRTTSPDSRVAGGAQIEDEFILIGEHTAEIDRGDTFQLNGRDWRVLRLELDNGYEKRAIARAVG